MGIRGIGVDLVEIARMSAAYGRHGDRLVGRICTPVEAELVRAAKSASLKLATLFGIKEAVMKALGTGMRGVGWKEIDTGGATEGSVESFLLARALEVARRLGVNRYCYSVTVSDELVLAAVLLYEDERALGTD